MPEPKLSFSAFSFGRKKIKNQSEFNLFHNSPLQRIPHVDDVAGIHRFQLPKQIRISMKSMNKIKI